MNAKEKPGPFEYSPWRHGGWYVHNVRYPGGAVGCVSRNYVDRKWRIVCDKRRVNGINKPGDFTYPSRDAAAAAEAEIANAERRAHTPGPWREAKTGNHQGLIVAETGANVAVAYDKRDAGVIALAPRLLAALRALVGELDEYEVPQVGEHFEFGPDSALGEARATLAEVDA